MRPRLLASAALSALVLLTALPAAAVESLDEARCVCADGALNQGDYVSCMSKFTRRLVAQGAIDKVERSNAVADASSEDLAAIVEGCSGSDGNLNVSGWGLGLQVGSAFYPAPSPSGVASAAEASLFLWNFSPQDVFQSTPVSPGGDCAFTVEIYDRVGNRLRVDDSVCLPTTGRLDMPIGTVEQRDFLIPLLALGADTSLVDGERLPSGTYRIRVTWDTIGPDRTEDAPLLTGSRPSAEITIRVGS